MQPVALNVFQKVMRLWDCVHPYNAGQCFVVPGPVEIERWLAAWKLTIRVLRLSALRMTSNRYEFIDAEPPEVIVLDPATDLCGWLSGQMNQPYPQGESSPFRPFILPGADQAHVGVIYHHWAADSYSIRMLLREWFLAVHAPHRCRNRPFDDPGGGFWRYFGPDAAGWDLREGCLALLRLRTRFGRARGVRYQPGAGHDVRFTLHDLPEETPQRLWMVARDCGIKVNDLFTAAVAEACDAHGVTPRTSGREDLAIGTIVDLRSHARVPMDSIFGMFLGFTTTVIRGSDLRRWPRLLASVAAQSELHRQTRAAAASVLRMAAAVIESNFFDPHRWSERYMRQMPMAAGLSNVNLAASWPAEFWPTALRRYIRVSPTSPLLPIVFTPTTLGNHLQIGVTWQTSMIDDAGAKSIISAVIDRLLRVACIKPAETPTAAA